jgi:hypothetical protein
MIKIQGIAIDEDQISEGLARLVDDLTDPYRSADRNAEKLFGLMVLMRQVSEDDRSLIMERVQYFSYLNTKECRQSIEAYRKTILNS